MGEELGAGAFQGFHGQKLVVVTSLRCLYMRTRNYSETKAKRVIIHEQKTALNGRGRKMPTLVIW